MNDIANPFSILHFILFADDTNLFYSNHNAHDLVCTLNCELSKLSDWFRANRLSFNVKKTNFILFGYKKIPEEFEKLKIYLDGVQINQVEHTKFLGVYLDAKLNWQKHATNVSQKISSGIGMLSRAKNNLPFYLLKMLYFAMIYPYLTYCNMIWGCASSQVLNSIFILQKRAIR